MKLEGKTVLVTGGARRIGAAIVRRLAAEGCAVVIHFNRSVKEAGMLVSELRAAGCHSWAISEDLSLPSAGNRLFDAAMAATGGRLDYVVNSASEYRESTLASMTESEVERQRRIHVEAPRELINRLAALDDAGMRAAVNILDARIGNGDDAHAAYMVAKRELSALTRSAAVEFAPRLRVNAVAPGAVLEPDGAPREELLRLAAFNPMKSVGCPGGLAECVLFLLESEFITGQTIFYDGGYNLTH